MTNHQYLVEKALVKYPKAKRIAVENATYGITKWDMGVAMNVGADTQAYKWNAHTVNAIRYVINNYVPETLEGACRVGNRGFILPSSPSVEDTAEQQRRDEKNGLYGEHVDVAN